MSTTLDYTTIDNHKWKNLPPPPGFASTSSKDTKISKSSSNSNTNTSVNVNVSLGSKSASYAALKSKRAWDFSISPAKSLPMQAFMLYMSGGGVQIFSLGIVFMLLITPFKSIAGMNKAFAQFAPPGSDEKAFMTLILPKLVYIACNLLTLGVGLWKCRSMGLLPTGTADWLAFETRGLAPEIML